MKRGEVVRWLLLGVILPMTGCHRSPSFRMESVDISPDGRMLAIVVRDGNTSFIYKVDVASGNATRLTDAKTGHERAPAFSPDGRRIAYIYSPGKGQPAAIVTQNVDGSNVHRWMSSGGGDCCLVFSLDGGYLLDGCETLHSCEDGQSIPPHAPLPVTWRSARGLHP